MAERLPWKTYRRRTTAPVQAFRNDGPRAISVRGDIGEAVTVHKGEWAVTSAGREARALSETIFVSLYELVEE